MRNNRSTRLIEHDNNDDGINRRGFLECMKWAGTGVIWTVSSGVLTSRAFSQNMKPAKGELHFVQISDSHMGFNKPANPDVAGTLKAAVDKVNALTTPPEFMLHTGDLSHLSKPEEFAIQFSRFRNRVFIPRASVTATRIGLPEAAETAVDAPKAARRPLTAQRIASDDANRVLVATRNISMPEIRKPGLNQPQHYRKDHRGRNPEQERSIRRFQRTQQSPGRRHNEITVT
jgi:hypothetical protein